MNQATHFVISEFTNPSGEIVYRVSGWQQGRRYRKNFSTRAEAAAECGVLEIAHVQSSTGVHTAATRLTDAQLQEAEAAFCRLKDEPHSLFFYLDYALTNYREPEHEVPLSDAIEKYLAVKRKDE
jgi:hypothetical protein